MNNFVYDRAVAEYHAENAERDISYYSSLVGELPNYSPDYIAALADAEARLKFWLNVTVTINNDEA